MTLAHHQHERMQHSIGEVASPKAEDKHVVYRSLLRPLHLKPGKEGDWDCSYRDLAQNVKDAKQRDPRGLYESDQHTMLRCGQRTAARYWSRPDLHLQEGSWLVYSLPPHPTAKQRL
jgi:hypothetical protein